MTSAKLLVFGTFVAVAVLLTGSNAIFSRAQSVPHAVEAPTGFDGQSNGMVDQATYDRDRALFALTETVDDGLGPVYNAASCAECHANPITGGSSQVLELRSGHVSGGVFVPHPGGSLIHSRATNAAIQERILEGNDVRTFRASPGTLGLGYVEAIPDQAFVEIADMQRRETGGQIEGHIIMVAVAEAPGTARVGRFGWKCQHASLVSFAGDAYLNEMGVTTPLFPVENTSNGRDISAFDPVRDPDEGDNDDVEAFAEFMRATKAPPRDDELAGREEARLGQQLFRSMGCAVCHVESILTAPAGTVLNGGEFVVPDALGSRMIHPFSDFLLHDIGTGDGIADEQYPETRNMIRTAPLWGLRTVNRYMHDGATLTLDEAIRRHAGEARETVTKFERLSSRRRRAVIAFLNSL